MDVTVKKNYYKSEARGFPRGGGGGRKERGRRGGWGGGGVGGGGGGGGHFLWLVQIGRICVVIVCSGILYH